MAHSFDPLEQFNITEIDARFLSTLVAPNQKLRTNVITAVVVPHERNLSRGRVSGQCLAWCVNHSNGCMR